MKQKLASRKMKILVAKLGLDGHDRGALVLCRAFRDAGMEVIYSGLFATPDRIAQIAEDEDVDAIALSLLNGAHNTLFPKVVKRLKKKGIKDVLVVGGGVIPQEDIPVVLMASATNAASDSKYTWDPVLWFSASATCAHSTLAPPVQLIVAVVDVGTGSVLPAPPIAEPCWRFHCCV